jgi:hypothetical protein
MPTGRVLRAKRPSRARTGRKPLGIAVIPTDKIVLDRLIALCEYDSSIVERVKAYFGEMTREGQSSLEVLDTALSNRQKAIQRVSKTIVLLTKNNVDDEGNVKAKGPTR